MDLDKSLFVSPTVHARQVTLGDGKQHDLFFREIPLATFREWQLAERSDDLTERLRAPAMLIAAGLCNKDGKDALSAEKAGTLKPKVAQRLVDIILEVNEFTGKKASPSAEPAGSATS